MELDIASHEAGPLVLTNQLTNERLCLFFHKNKDKMSTLFHKTAHARQQQVNGINVWIGPEGSTEDNGVDHAVFPSGYDDIESTIDTVIAFYKPRCDRFYWVVGPAEFLDSHDRLLQRGFQLDEAEPAMMVELSPDASELDNIYESLLDVIEDFNIVEVHTGSQVQQWVRTWAFDAPESAIEHWTAVYMGVFELTRSSVNEFTMFLGLKSGQPVGTGFVYCDGSTAAVHYIVTLPEYRRQGIGKALTVHGLKLSRDFGYRVAMLNASDYGIGIYRSLGFKEFGWQRTYIWAKSTEMPGELSK
ncbi:acyl-CoA N-acyltransferase [Thozetella sp. PMI_491]|nr:acyl-CoA N-acyltransferase [Thozetella sp. PMI_491]